MEFLGYRRADGRVGVRNHVAVVSTVLCSSAVIRQIAEVTGAMAVTHEAGCGELGPEKEHTERVLRGVVTHPNMGAVLVVGLGCEQIEPERLAQAVTDRPARYLSIQKLGGRRRPSPRGPRSSGRCRMRLPEPNGARRAWRS